ncbi:hypothetical protein FDECE_9010 [Fusarium decemcellulare]|nr:hypothetical protein FDECE_9010 [Fusarium decemcellulare]
MVSYLDFSSRHNELLNRMDDHASRQVPLYASNVDVEGWLPEPSKDPTPRLAGALFEAILALFTHLARAFSDQQLDPTHSIDSGGLLREVERLFLWGDGCSVGDGQLDDILSKSSELRHSVFSSLYELGVTLKNTALRAYVSSDNHAASGLEGLVKELHSLLEQTSFLLYGSDGLDDHDTISDSGSSINELVECFEDISTYIDCLMDLSLALENPVLDPEPTDTNVLAGRSLEIFDVSSHALAFCLKIRDRFPKVEKRLVERLGEANALRASVLTDVRERMEALEHVDTVVPDKAGWVIDCPEESCIPSETLFSDSQPKPTVTTRSTVPPDSIFDTSNPDYPAQLPTPREPISRTVHIPASDASLVSFASFSTKASAITSGRPRVPPLPEEALEGKSFSCLACHQQIAGGISRKDWKRHIFEDLSPYVCTLPGCKSETTLHKSTRAWVKHETEHRAQDWQSSECLFCDKGSFSVSSSSYYKHVAEHLREISLAALPHIPESDIEDSSSEGEISVNDLGDGIDRATAADSSEANESESDPAFKGVTHIYDNGVQAHMAWEQSRRWADLKASPRWKGRRINVMSVADEIRNSYTQSALNSRSYLPLDHLIDILRPDIVWQLLSQNFNKKEATLLKFEVLGNQDPNAKAGPAPPRRRRIFAILILIQAIQRLQDFVAADVDDTALPLTFEPKGDAFLRDNIGHKLPECFSQWPSITAKAFCLEQESIHVPFFHFQTEEILWVYQLQPRAALPFTRYDQDDDGYWNMRRVHIHSAHHDYDRNIKVTSIPLGFYETMITAINNIQGQQPRDFSARRTHFQNIQDYFHQFRAYNRFGAVWEDLYADHHLAPQLAYKHGRDYFLLFPWATGNLYQFFEKRKADPSSLDELCWFFERCWGIARCLDKIHRLDALARSLDVLENPTHEGSSRCGHIKLENILWFEDYKGQRDFFTMTDFALTQTRPDPQKTSTRKMSGKYRPPEVHFMKPMSQKYDVWSLGCVLLEFISWFLLGYEQTFDVFTMERIEEHIDENMESRLSRQNPFFIDILSQRDAFPQEDAFFSLIDPETSSGSSGGGMAEVRNSVLEWIKKLHGTQHSSSALHELLDLIQYNMLVPVPESRSSSEFINNKLWDLYREVLHSRWQSIQPSTGTGQLTPSSHFIKQQLTQKTQLSQYRMHTLTFQSGEVCENKVEVGLGRGFGQFGRINNMSTNKMHRSQSH